ncbi:hypothetical protein Hte_010626 [Hypoxylon texense]
MASAYDDFKALNAAIDSTPLIDNHAHPLLTPENAGTRSLLSIASEAGGDALEDSKASLAHLRAVKQLAAVLGCEQTWEAVVENAERKRLEDRDGWIRRCLEGIETILIDDGLDMSGRVETYDWHSNFTKSKCKRIVRIETVASDIIARLSTSPTASKAASVVLGEFVDQFTKEIGRYVKDPEVAGFKSIICYRRGLDIPTSKTHTIPEAEEALLEIVRAGVKADSPVSGFSLKRRLEHSPLNSLIVHYVAVVVRDARSSKPIQFHTGLGDTDITLTKSSPSHLQSFIEEYPDVRVILLHAGYPWTRETAYLATMYPNVYADIGEVIPYLSRQGQEGIVKQMLEVCPWTKVLCSTDAHGFPEMYLIATTQIRSVLKTVLGDLVRTRQLDEKQAVQLAQAVLHTNSKRVYNLETESPLPTFEQLGAFPYTITAPPLQGSSSNTNEAIIQKLQSLQAKYLRICWHDYTSSAKCRLLPIKQVYKALSRGKPVTVSVARAGLGLLQTDMMIPQINASGMYALRPVWSSLKPGPVAGHVSCFGEFTHADDGGGAEEVLCPRTVLRKTVEKAKARGLTFLLGFEVEFVVMERNSDATSPDKYLTLRNDGHAWSVARAFADWGRPGSFSTAADEVLDTLDAAGIEVEQFHPESAAGQFELVLGALPPLEAVDALLQARQILEAVSARHGFRVTLHPKPFAQSCGSASHMHMSISSAGGDLPATYEPFYAGVLTHLPAVLAFAYSNPTSYARMLDSAWAGGRWITWGTQNKEAPLRRVAASHWEVKVIDGLANPYFVVAAVLAAGMDGIERGTPLAWKDFPGDPAKLSAEERAALGIETMFPADLREALRALGEDTGLDLDSEFVRRYVDIKNAELEFLLDPLSPEDLRRWVLERY